MLVFLLSFEKFLIGINTFIRGDPGIILSKSKFGFMFVDRGLSIYFGKKRLHYHLDGISHTCEVQHSGNKRIIRSVIYQDEKYTFVSGVRRSWKSKKPNAVEELEIWIPLIQPKSHRKVFSFGLVSKSGKNVDLLETIRLLKTPFDFENLI